MLQQVQDQFIFQTSGVETHMREIGEISECFIAVPSLLDDYFEMGEVLESWKVVNDGHVKKSIHIDRKPAE